MAKKTVYFNTIHIFDSRTKRELDYKELKEKYKEIITNAKSNALILQDGENPITMDIIFNSEDYLFVRLGKGKDNSTIQFRDTKTLETSEVIGKKDAENKRLEVFTYCLIDYNCGILSIVSGQAAPNEHSINFIMDRYNNSYRTEIANICSPNSIKALLNPGSVLSNITYTVAVPDTVVLSDKEIVGLNRKQVVSLKEASTKQVTVVLKNEDRGALSNSIDTIKKIVGSFEDVKDTYKSLKFHGKTFGGASKDYFFENTFYNSKIDIKDKLKKVILDKKELDDEYFIKIKEEYIRNKEQLLVLSNRNK